MSVYDSRNPGKKVFFGDNTNLPEDVQEATYKFMLDNSVVH
jgi:hypothetical protein